jgi:hypothetical protein
MTFPLKHKNPCIARVLTGADNRTRTYDPSITSCGQIGKIAKYNSFKLEKSRNLSILKNTE